MQRCHNPPRRGRAKRTSEAPRVVGAAGQFGSNKDAANGVRAPGRLPDHDRCELDTHLTHLRKLFTVAQVQTVAIKFTGMEVKVMFTAIAEALPLKKRVLRGRRLVAVDIENVSGGALTRTEHAAAVRRCLESTVGCRDTDQTVIGTSHIGVMACGLGWKGSRLVVRPGQDGADLALLDVLAGENIAARFDEVVIVSGDGIFAGNVALLGARGVDATVVSRREACSRRLRMAARTVLFPEPQLLEKDVA